MGEFKHITVTAAEEDDEVIVAGVGAVGSVVDKVENELQPDTPSEAAIDFGPESASASALETEQVAAPASEQVAAPVPSVQPQAVSAKRKSARTDDYHETTLDDLESGGMPLAQKIVIIAAVVCIIGALVYYFAVMR